MANRTRAREEATDKGKALLKVQHSAEDKLRTANRQIVKAYKQLGENAQVTRNWASTIKAIFGEDAIRYNKDNIPQIKTGKKFLEEYNRKRQTHESARKETKLEELERRTRVVTSSKDKNGKSLKQWNRLYDVTKKRNEIYEKAHEKLRKEALKTEEIKEKKTIEEKTNYIDDYIKENLKEDMMKEFINFDELASELWGYYNAYSKYSFLNDDDEKDYDDFVKMYHKNRAGISMFDDEDNLDRFSNLLERLKDTQTEINDFHEMSDEEAKRTEEEMNEARKQGKTGTKKVQINNKQINKFIR